MPNYELTPDGMTTRDKGIAEVPIWYKGEIVGFAKVDVEDGVLANSRKWNLFPHKTTRYARSTSGKKCLLMHRVIMGNPKGEIDHINGDGLDNRTLNLRVGRRTCITNTGRTRVHTKRCEGASGQLVFTKMAMGYILEFSTRNLKPMRHM